MRDTAMIFPLSEMTAELKGVLRCFERDDAFQRREERSNRPGVLVFITRKQADRIRVAIAKAEEAERGHREKGKDQS